MDKDLKESGNNLCGEGITGRGNSKCKGDRRVLGTGRAEQGGHCYSWREVGDGENNWKWSQRVGKGHIILVVVRNVALLGVAGQATVWSQTEEYHKLIFHLPGSLGLKTD